MRRSVPGWCLAVCKYIQYIQCGQVPVSGLHHHSILLYGQVPAVPPTVPHPGHCVVPHVCLMRISGAPASETLPRRLAATPALRADQTAVSTDTPVGVVSAAGRLKGPRPGTSTPLPFSPARPKPPPTVCTPLSSTSWFPPHHPASHEKHVSGPPAADMRCQGRRAGPSQSGPALGQPPPPRAPSSIRVPPVAQQRTPPHPHPPHPPPSARPFDRPSLVRSVLRARGRRRGGPPAGAELTHANLRHAPPPHTPFLQWGGGGAGACPPARPFLALRRQCRRPPPPPLLFWVQTRASRGR